MIVHTETFVNIISDSQYIDSSLFLSKDFPTGLPWPYNSINLFNVHVDNSSETVFWKVL